MNIVNYLESRGLIEQASSSEIQTLLEKPRSIYFGIDPTAPSIHLGNLLGLVVLRVFQKYGHKPVIVMGGMTAMVGDPSGTSKERPFLSKKEIDSNIEKIKKTIEFCLDFENEETRPIILNNADWYDDMSMLYFLREIGKQFRLGPMLAKESVKNRLNSDKGMSYIEFSYQLLQAYDFAYLHRNNNVEFQIGGSDQYGNITAGIEYTRKVSGASVYGLVFPLLTRSDGKKFGKSEGGAIWLDRDMFSPFDFYQHIMRFPDKDIISLLMKLTFLPLDEILLFEQKYLKDELEPFSLQRLLAEELTKFVHGDDGLKEAIKATEAMAIGSSELNMNELKNALPGLPTVNFLKKEVVGISYVDLLCKSGLLSSKGEGRRLIKNNGAYLNKVRVSDPNLVIQEDDLLDGELILLSSGKKKSLVIQIN